MVLFVGPLYSGKKQAAADYARQNGKRLEDLRVIEDVPSGVTDPAASAEELSAYDIVLFTEVGSGLVPVDAEDRAARENAGRLSVLLAERADEVYRVYCGIARRLK